MHAKFDIIVVGGGHAGCEAAMASANLGSKVLFITMNMQGFGQMSCNPAMGGIAKGQIIREIDAMGGYTGIVTDQSMIQFRMLNKSKGPAMWSPRSQNDRVLFSIKWREALEKNPNLSFIQDQVTGLIIKNQKACGVVTKLGMEVESKAVVLTNGTFLNGKIHVGKSNSEGGRMGENSAKGITESLKEFDFESGRLKTGTPPRLDGRTIDYSKTEIQYGDEIIYPFSFREDSLSLKPKQQKCCWITYTNSNVHEILSKGFEDSPMFSGKIKGVGPRYCPSIEDKIFRFAERQSHQLFIEPEGFHTNEIYLNGFSTSLPYQIQLEALKQIKGLENCKVFRPGYAIEYDYFSPSQLSHSLETKNISHLFFAGQINGTTGYEEAACQGLIAGINAHQRIRELEPLVLKRHEAYIGVLIDDLITKGTKEPYRMFTSRSEYRTLLRQDNADLRLTEKSYTLGLASRERMSGVEKKKKDTDKIIGDFKKKALEPKEVNTFLKSIDSAPINQKQKIENILLRPEVKLEHLIKHIEIVKQLCENKLSTAVEQAEIQIKYKAYIDKEKEAYEKQKGLGELIIPKDFDYKKIKSLSKEAIEKLSHVQPRTIDQASRIPGVNPTDIQLLLIYMGR